jgi:peroxisomal membrane protein 2
MLTFSLTFASGLGYSIFTYVHSYIKKKQFQVLAANVIALVWNVILSFKAHKEVLPK